jgi:Tfp pilus assembly protein PilF
MQHFTAVLTPSKAYYNVASVLEQQGQKVQARMYYRQALDSDPNMRDAQHRLAAMDRN